MGECRWDGEEWTAGVGCSSRTHPGCPLCGLEWVGCTTVGSGTGGQGLGVGQRLGVGRGNREGRDGCVGKHEGATSRMSSGAWGRTRGVWGNPYFPILGVRKREGVEMTREGVKVGECGWGGEELTAGVVCSSRHIHLHDPLRTNSASPRYSLTGCSRKYGPTACSPPHTPPPPPATAAAAGCGVDGRSPDPVLLVPPSCSAAA